MKRKPVLPVDAVAAAELDVLMKAAAWEREWTGNLADTYDSANELAAAARTLRRVGTIANHVRAALEERDGVWRSAVNRHDACGICDVDDEEPCTACAPLRALMKEGT